MGIVRPTHEIFDAPRSCVIATKFRDRGSVTFPKMPRLGKLAATLGRHKFRGFERPIYFTAPMVNPRAMYLCTSSPPIITGAETIVALAITSGQGIV